MKVSIITVCYNSSDTIEDTIQSVVSQTYPNIEYIVIDGGSSDGTQRIINSYSARIDYFVSEPDQGIYDAMNKGLQIAEGDVIGILNSDDFFASKDAVEQIVNKFESKNVDAVYADVVYVEPLATNNITRLYSGKVFKPSLIRLGFMLPHPTFYVKRSVLQMLGGYKMDYRVAADFEFIARFFTKGFQAVYLDMVLVKMREGGISSSGLLWRVHQNFEIVRACRENGINTNILFVALKLPYKLWTLLKPKLGFVKVAN